MCAVLKVKIICVTVTCRIYNGVNGWIDPSFYFGASESVFVLPGFARVHSAL